MVPWLANWMGRAFVMESEKAVSQSRLRSSWYEHGEGEALVEKVRHRHCRSSSWGCGCGL
jgi:hypothetical protein